MRRQVGLGWHVFNLLDVLYQVYLTIGLESLRSVCDYFSFTCGAGSAIFQSTFHSSVPRALRWKLSRSSKYREFAVRCYMVDDYPKLYLELVKLEEYNSFFALS